MKKLLLFLSVLVFALSSCDRKEIVQNNGNGLVSVNMDLSSGVKVSRVSRASNDFVATVPTSYKVYFVSAEKTEEYGKGDIVKTADVVLGDNNIQLPDIKYNIYVTNYVPSTPKTEADIKSMIESIPVSSSTLYLVKEDDGVIFHNTKTITETLVNNYAAVCILNNKFVTGAQYNTPPMNSFGTATYTLSGDWYYLYVKGNSTNTTIWLKNIPYNTGSYQLKEDIEPNYIYEYTVTDDTNAKFVLKTEPFAGVNKKDLVVE